VSRERIGVTGFGLVTPIGHDWSEFNERLWSGRSGITEVDLFDTRHAPSRAGGQVRGFRAREWMPPGLAREVERLGDRRAAFAAASLLAAWDHAGMDRAYTGDRVALSLGTGSTSHDYRELGDLFARLRGGGDDRIRSLLERPARPAARRRAPRHLVDATLGAVAEILDVRGPRQCHVSTCAASGVAVATALRMLRRGDVDACLTGGCDSLLTPNGVASFALLGALSVADRPPHDLLRPFDRRRDGMVIGEGATVFVLERVAAARERGATVYAEVCGAGLSMDAFNVLAPHPEGRGATLAMARALADGDLAPASVDYVNAHGTATALNDPAETRAIKRVLGRHVSHVPVSSSKPMFGHLIGASGAVEMLVALAALVEQRIPPTLNLREPDPECDLDYVPQKARAGNLRVVLSNSFGFGGYNACVALGRGDP